MNELNNMLPKDIRKMIDKLTMKLNESEKSKFTIGRIIDFEKILYAVLNAVVFISLKMENIKKDKNTNVKIVIRSLIL